jgi:hypothetical protein
MSGLTSGSPGSHPHADRPNWQPATTADEYISNVREGLEPLSKRRLAKLLGMTRIELYRVELMSELPEELFERLLAAGVRSSKGLAAIALAIKRDQPLAHDDERCPHCGWLLRRRRVLSRKSLATVAAYLVAEHDPH